MKHIIWDTEILGKENPVFVLNAFCPEDNKKQSFWFHKKGHMEKLWKLIDDPDYIWVGFNSIKFDSVITAGVMWGMDTHEIKELASSIIQQRLQPFQIYKRGVHEEPPFDLAIDPALEDRFQRGKTRHIDVFEVAPGVKTSLKVYMARMHAPTLIDLPYHHDEEIDTPAKQKTVETYCWNDVDGTHNLFKALKSEIELRDMLSDEFEIDLMSKSDAQMAEAVFKKELKLPKPGLPPRMVRYKCPRQLIKTTNKVILSLIEQAENWEFEINQSNGSPVMPEWMADNLVAINDGRYKFGLGGLHSAHDKQLYVVSDNDEVMVSDFDVASYYPNLIIRCGFTPNMAGAKGAAFLDLYSEFLHRRIEAKRSGNKKVANALKIFLNGSYGKLGSMYSRLYAPDLLLGVTITGQLNLLCLINELERIKGVSVLSANTDGIMVKFNKATHEKVREVFAKNGKRTQFDYEETRYKIVALRDVNNYIAITEDGTVKGKGDFGDVDSKPDLLRTHRTFTICQKAVLAYIQHGTPVDKTIRACKDIRDFVAIANGDGQSGGIQTVKVGTFDDWTEVEDRVWQNSLGKKVKRKSRPPAYEGPVPGSEQRIGRIARWYISTDPKVPDIRTVNGLRRVGDTEGGKLCMTLPTSLPKDIDYDWYINRANKMLASVGVTV